MQMARLFNPANKSKQINKTFHDETSVVSFAQLEHLQNESAQPITPIRANEIRLAIQELEMA